MKKKVLLAMAISILIFQGCGQKKDKDEQQESKRPSDTKVQKDGNIPIEKAAELTYGYVTHPQLTKVFKGQPIGGTFPKSFFEVKSPDGGVLLWFCYKGGKKPEFFLALEQITEYDTAAHFPKQPSAAILKKPKGLFNYNAAAPADKLDVIKFFQGHKVVQNDYEDISNSDVQKYVASFDSLMNVNLASNGRKYSKYSFCFFDKKRDFNEKTKTFFDVPDYEDFLKQTPDDGFVRYYFGFDDNDKPNRIRVVLFSANSNGANITTVSGADAIILQKSFPPPPYN